MIENYQEMLQNESNGFIRHNGIRIISVDEEKSVLKAEVTDLSRNTEASSTRWPTPPRARSRALSMAGAT